MTRSSIDLVRLAEAPRSRRSAPAAIAAAVALSLAAVSAPALAQTATAPAPAIQTGPLTLTFGGFTELATIYRNRNESADVGSDFNTGIPFYDNTNSQVSEFRESARQSRFSLLAQGESYDGLKPEAYMETDFLSAGVTSNSRESNSYTLRMRVFYGRMQTDWGLDVVAGQSWSLATLYKDGLNVRDENAPVGIDAQYIAGFNWTRNPQLRVVEHFSKAFSLGLSLESPQAVTSNGINSTGLPTGTTFPPSSVDYQNSGDSAGLENSTTTYTTDPAPDVIVKAAFDPGFGHYEVYGLGRQFRSTIDRAGDTVSGGGVGGGLILPVLPKLLSFQASGLVGKGIGRYGSAQLPDVTMEPTGQLAPIKEYDVLFGLLLTPTDRITIYGYAGREKESATYYNVGTATYGYGAPQFNNSGCEALSGTCVGNTRSIDEVSAGFWWKYYQGMLGNLQFGVQGEYLQRDAFEGVGGAPEANMFVGMASFRYYPYQK
ncbi:MAG TPA: hypothetical protein VMU52_01070 [Steroidobacteraceae bacterium]|nr:hypothetical protein [Steroidobacteraceae bacterium]